MISIGKLGAGRGEYYLAQVAHGVEDYYTGSGEAPGQWFGSGIDALGLAGQVDAEDLRAVLAGVAPSGEPLGRPNRKTPGFDVCFSAPKSVSLFHALGRSDIATAVQAGHEEAVRQALGYLEREACLTRRGTNGVDVLGAEGFVAAAFLHRTSREGDPQLHSHVLIANAVRGVDGRWSTLDARHLYAHAKTADRLYQAVLRDELTRRLGVAWTPVERGAAEIRGVDRRTVMTFSTRRRQILDAVKRRGERSAAARQVATLGTRTAKSADDRSYEQLRVDWLARGERIGLTPDLIDRLTGVEKHLSQPMASRSRTDLLSPLGLTKERSSFDRRDVIAALCDALPHGAPVAHIEGLTDQLLADREVLPLASSSLQARFATSFQRGDGRKMPAPLGGHRYTTREMAGVEAAVVANAKERVGIGAAIAPTDAVEAGIRLERLLAPEQRDMVRRLLRDGNGVEVVIGKAGAGKTLALDTARLVWQATGTPVIGCALSARAAEELRTSAGMPSGTLAKLAREVGLHGLPQGSVVVVDEAAMVGTRTLQWLTQVTERAGAKLVLVGDDRQLPAIDAGGGFRALADAIDPIRLDTNRRQRTEWERNALDRLARGDTSVIVDYARHGRVTVSQTADAVRDLLIADWHAARGTGVDARMLALHRGDVHDLNRRARLQLKAAGELTGPELETGGRFYAVGDTVIGRRNDYRAKVLNGTRGTVIALHHDERSLTIETAAGQQVKVPSTYLAAGHLDHGYATTVHKAQGATFDEAFVLGSDQLYREAGYVALSRGRDSNRLYIVDNDPHDEHHTHDHEDGLDALRRGLGRSHAEVPVRDRVMSPDVSDAPDLF